MGQRFPPPRLHESFQNNNVMYAGLQSPLNMLSDMAVMDGNSKRAAKDNWNLQHVDAKRQKMASSSDSSSVVKESPALMQRLSSLSGGFPMPKWAGAMAVPRAREGSMDVASSSPVAKQVLPKHGAFPMPALKDGGSSKAVSSSSLRSYRELWKDTDMDLREEVLARRLERASLKISNRHRRSS